VSLLQPGGQILGADLNCFESTWAAATLLLPPKLPHTRRRKTAALQDLDQAYVRFGSIATEALRVGEQRMSALPRKRTRSRASALCHVWTAPSWQGFSSRLQAGRCGHVFGLLARHKAAGHNALRGSGPSQKPAFKMHWHMWVVLIAGSAGSALRAVRPPNLHITPGSRRDLVHAASATGSL
jgi:hypothetical protein